ncbi:hypothetical protein FGG08_004773 [Glutinoglossum americanum]|uniref:Uncharacterized protein n=1 Tax=Glutinoglossum americanum TaxID=1670608 RepID=A0A9P8L248_9PEZI|nr:hypothetical protein FGG08_004773 [Glutinoglossum americanum]
MEPWKSWAAFVVLGTGAGWYYYNTQNKPKSKTARAASISVEAGNKPARKREEGKAKSRKDGVVTTKEFSESDFAEGFTAATSKVPALRKDKGKKGKGTKAKTEKPGVGSTIKPVETTDSNSEKQKGPVNGEDRVDEDLDNKEFAKMLSELKSNKPVKDLAKKRVREEETKVNGAIRGRTHLSITEPAGSAPRNASTTSSTTGADADDDLSPVASPFMEARPVGEAYEDAGLSDMLEAPPSGPSVLRLTEPTQPARTQRPKQQVSQIQETKKQRQNRKKNEAKKAEREEAENERRILLEKQRRTAREAEGRPAKNGMGNGMGFASKSLVTSVWASSGELVNGRPESEASLETGDILYLDTFESNQNSRAGGSSLAVAAKGTPLDNWERDLPSEEEQLRIINEMNDGGWNTVPGTRKGKKKGAIGSDHASNESSGPERQVESTGPAKDPSTSKAGNSDVWGFGNAVPRIVKNDGVNGDDWAVDGGWESKKQ